MILREKKMDNIAKNLKQYRVEHGMKQTEMANLLDMNYQNYSKMERGVYQPSLEKLLEICSVLEITPNDLLLDGREFDDYKQEIFEEMDASILDMMDTMKIVEKLRSDATMAHNEGDYEGEKAVLKEVIRLFAKEDKYNEVYWKIADFVYYDYINEHIRQYSDNTHDGLVSKKMAELIKGGKE